MASRAEVRQLLHDLQIANCVARKVIYAPYRNRFIGSGYLNSAVSFCACQGGLATGRDLVAVATGRLDVASGCKLTES